MSSIKANAKWKNPGHVLTSLLVYSSELNGGWVLFMIFISMLYQHYVWVSSYNTQLWNRVSSWHRTFSQKGLIAPNKYNPNLCDK